MKKQQHNYINQSASCSKIFFLLPFLLISASFLLSSCAEEKILSSIKSSSIKGDLNLEELAIDSNKVSAVYNYLIKLQQEIAAHPEFITNKMWEDLKSNHRINLPSEYQATIGDLPYYSTYENILIEAYHSERLTPGVPQKVIVGLEPDMFYKTQHGILKYIPGSKLGVVSDSITMVSLDEIKKSGSALWITFRSKRAANINKISSKTAQNIDPSQTVQYIDPQSVYLCLEGIHVTGKQDEYSQDEPSFLVGVKSEATGEYIVNPFADVILDGSDQADALGRPYKIDGGWQNDDNQCAEITFHPIALSALDLGNDFFHTSDLVNLCVIPYEEDSWNPFGKYLFNYIDGSIWDFFGFKISKTANDGHDNTYPNRRFNFTLQRVTGFNCFEPFPWLDVCDFDDFYGWCGGQWQVVGGGLDRFPGELTRSTVYRGTTNDQWLDGHWTNGHYIWVRLRTYTGKELIEIDLHKRPTRSNSDTYVDALPTCN